MEAIVMLIFPLLWCLVVYFWSVVLFYAYKLIFVVGFGFQELPHYYFIILAVLFKILWLLTRILFFYCMRERILERERKLKAKKPPIRFIDMCGPPMGIGILPYKGRNTGKHPGER